MLHEWKLDANRIYTIHKLTVEVHDALSKKDILNEFDTCSEALVQLLQPDKLLKLKL